MTLWKTKTLAVALMTAALLTGRAPLAYAICDNNVPANGASVICTSAGGTDNVGISGGADNVSVAVNGSANINTTGVSAINLGAGTSVNNNGNIISDTTTILFGGGNVSNNQFGISISSSTGTAIQFNGVAGTAATVANVGNITGTGGVAVDFGDSNANYRIAPGSNTNSSVLAGAGVTDRLTLGGTSGTGTFDSSNIGVQYTGFEVFEKSSSVTWNLTGTTGAVVNWALQSGTMSVTTNSLQGNAAISGAASLQFNQSFDGTYGGTLSGGGNVFKVGTGTVAFTYTGAQNSTSATTVNAGTIAVHAATSIGSGALTLNNGTLQYNAGFSSGRNIIVNGGGGTINTNGFDATITGGVSGSSTLTKTGTGMLTITNAGNNYMGGTIINQGTVAVAANGALGNVAGGLSFGGGTLQYNGNFSSARNVTLNAGGGTLNTNSYNATLTGTITGTGILTKTGTGALILSGVNNYSGGTVLTNGVLQVSADSGLGSVAGALTIDGGTLQAGADFTMARAVTLGAGNATIDTQAHDMTLNGAITGAGQLTKTGAGLLYLGGANNYTGGTLVSAGTLAGTAASLPDDIANNATVRFVQDADGTYSHIISGTGALEKTGAGALTLDAVHSYSGGTTVADGLLVVNGTIIGLTTVEAGGSLGGTGTTGEVISNGALAPGNSIGTLNIDGDLTINAGSTYVVEVDNGGDSDSIVATGAVFINGGTVDVRAANGTYAAETDYTILQGATVAGTFDNVTSNLAFLDPSLQYNADNVVLTLTRNDTAIETVAADPTQASVGAAVEELGPDNELYDAFISLSTPQAQAALDSLSGEHNAGLTAATVATNAAVHTIVAGRIFTVVQNESGISSGNESADPGSWQVWSKAVGTKGRNRAEGSAPAQERHSAGLVVGADVTRDNIIAGIYGGYAQGQVYTNSQQANSDIESLHAGLYGARAGAGRVRVSGALDSSYHMVDTTRHVSFPGFSRTAKGETYGYTLSAYAELSYGGGTDQTQIEPFAGVNVTHSRIDDYAESGGGPANLHVGSARKTVPGHIIGVRAAHLVSNDAGTGLQLRGQLGWRHNYGGLGTDSTMRFSAGTTPFTVRGPSIVRDAAVVGAGAEARIGGRTALYVDYDGLLSPDEQNHSLSAGIKVRF